MKIKKGDRVIVVTGKDKGVNGQGHRGLPRDRPGPRRGRQPDQEAHQDRPVRAWRQDRRHRDPGGRVHVSNVMLVVEVDGKKVGTRVGYRVETVDARRPREDGSGPLRQADR